MNTQQRRNSNQNEELINHIRESMPLTKKAIHQLGDYMEKIESIFNDPLHFGKKSISLQDSQKDKVLEIFLDNVNLGLDELFNDIIYKLKQSTETTNIRDIPSDFQYMNLRNYLREMLMNQWPSLLEMYKVQTDTQCGKELLRQIQLILSTHDFLYYNSRSKENIQFLFLQLNIPSLLNSILEQQNRNQNLADNLKSFFVFSIKKFIKQSQQFQIKSTNYKETTIKAALDKLNLILKGNASKSNFTQFDAASIAQKVIDVDHNIVFQEIQLQIKKETEKIIQDQKIQPLNKGSSTNQKEKEIYKQFGEIKSEWDELKTRQIYLTLTNDPQSLSRASQFQNRVNNAHYKTVNLFDNLSQFQNQEKEKILLQASQNAIKSFKQMLPGLNPYKDQIGKYIDQLFYELDQTILVNLDLYNKKYQNSIFTDLSSGEKINKKIEADALKVQNLSRRSSKEVKNENNSGPAQNQFKAVPVKENIQVLKGQDYFQPKASKITRTEPKTQQQQTNVNSLQENQKKPQIEPLILGAPERIPEVNTNEFQQQQEFQQDQAQEKKQKQLQEQEILRQKQQQEQQEHDQAQKIKQKQLQEQEQESLRQKQQQEQQEHNQAQEKKQKLAKEQELLQKKQQQEKQEHDQAQEKKRKLDQEQEILRQKQQQEKEEHDQAQEKKRKLELEQEILRQKQLQEKQEHDQALENKRKLEQEQELSQQKKQQEKYEHDQAQEKKRKLEQEQEILRQKQQQEQQEHDQAQEKKRKLDQEQEILRQKQQQEKEEHDQAQEKKRKLDQEQEILRQKQLQEKQEHDQAQEKKQKLEQEQEILRQKQYQEQQEHDQAQEKKRKLDQEQEILRQKQQQEKEEHDQAQEKKRKLEQEQEILRQKQQQEKYEHDLAQEKKQKLEQEQELSLQKQQANQRYEQEQKLLRQKQEQEQYQQDQELEKEKAQIFDQEEQYQNELFQGEQNSQEEGYYEGQIEQFQINTVNNLHLVNDYIKKTQYGGQNLIRLDDYNAYDYVFQIFEEFLQQGLAYFLDYSQGQKLIEINDFMLAGEDPNNELEEYMQEIMMNFQQMTQLQDFDPGMRIFMPFDLSFNRFMFLMIEKNPQTKIINIYYESEPNEELMNEEFENMIGLFQELFNCADYQVGQIVLPSKTQQVFETLGDESMYIRYMLMVFTVLYESDSPQEPQVGEDTLERLFWCMNSCGPLYEKLESDRDQLMSHFQNLLVEQSKDKNILIESLAYASYDAQTTHQALGEIKNKMLNNKTIQQGFVMVEIQHEDIKYVYYINLSRVQSQMILKVFLLSHYGAMNEEFMQLIIDEADTNYQQKIYIDFARHNGLYEYNNMTFPTWIHLSNNQKYKPEDALSILNFTLAPLHILSDDLE